MFRGRVSVLPVTSKSGKAPWSPQHFSRREPTDRLVFFGEHILSYCTSKLLNYGFALFKGSVINTRILINVLTFVTIGTVYGMGVCGHTGNPKVSYYGEYCWPSISIQEGTVFAALVSFLLSMLITTVFNRWWTMRSLIREIVGRTNDCAIQLSCYVNAPPPLAQSNASRSTAPTGSHLQSSPTPSGSSTQPTRSFTSEPRATQTSRPSSTRASCQTKRRSCSAASRTNSFSCISGSQSCLSKRPRSRSSTSPSRPFR